MYIRRKIYSVVYDETTGEERLYSVSEQRQFNKLTDFLKRKGIMKKSIKDRARFAAEDTMEALKKGGRFTKEEAEKAIELAKKNPKASLAIGGSALVAGTGAVAAKKLMKKKENKED